MSREVRKVTPDWEHPKDGSGEYEPLFEGYAEDAEDFLEMVKEKGLQEAVENYGCPDKTYYMPDWEESEATHYMMYETTSEGTPISPAFESPEQLAHWLTDTGASAFASVPGTYDGWLRVANGGYASSIVIVDGACHSGVDGI